MLEVVGSIPSQVIPKTTNSFLAWCSALRGFWSSITYKQMRKIYFCGSIRAGRQDVELYGRIIEQLQAYGIVLTEHVANKEIELSEVNLDDKFIHDRDIEWLENCDAVVAEVTQPSLGVGYEIGRAVAMKKRLLCLFRPASGKKLSAMIGGAYDSQSFIVKHYAELDVPQILQEFFSY
ncbi:hypothetical protein CHS0354_005901 [Potamilus streckersoni]|uniref:Putative 2'-deoxynucleoside 5'-phosphate N-hydrolase 1 n=1 Tax=Potamilus streckersoni TaxID=2493646 RepID=A0AAE0W9N8_9BIVA|nr:hypothetical protein CHS0354_005901 [Potamilus streckersoni]